MPRRPYTAPLPASLDNYTYGSFSDISTGGPVKEAIPAGAIADGFFGANEAQLAGATHVNQLKNDQAKWFEHAGEITEFARFEATGAFVLNAQNRPVVVWSLFSGSAHNASLSEDGTRFRMSGAHAYIIDLELTTRRSVESEGVFPLMRLQGTTFSGLTLATNPTVKMAPRQEFTTSLSWADAFNFEAVDPQEGDVVLFPPTAEEGSYLDDVEIVKGALTISRFT